MAKERMRRLNMFVTKANFEALKNIAAFTDAPLSVTARQAIALGTRALLAEHDISEEDAAGGKKKYIWE